MAASPAMLNGSADLHNSSSGLKNGHSSLFNGHADPTSSKQSQNGNDDQVKKLKALYSAAGQSHVFTFYDQLSPSEQSALLTQLGGIDIKRVNKIYRNAVAADQAITPPTHTIPLDDTLGVGGNMIGRSRSPSPTGQSTEENLPLPKAACASIIDNPADEAKWREIGLQAIADNQVAVLLMAGGQGTRLGSALPKGMYDISLPSGLTLFQIQAGRIKRLQSVAEKACGKPAGSVVIKWYVMTSGPTREVTTEYFQKMNNFGLKSENVIFFEQGTLPALSNEGKLMLSSKSSVAVAPDGNGGLYGALRRPLTPGSSRTVLSDIKANNIQYIHAYCVDNCLVKVADPIFIGACIARHAAAGAKVVRKHNPTESVGVFAKKGDAYAVVEYSELSKEKAAMRAEDGTLSFWAANIVQHLWNASFLEGVEAMENKMAFHIARKKIPTIDLQTGEAVKPDSPNGMKLEMFVFDVFPFTKSLCVLEVDRAEEFSPLKNAPGSNADCPETSRRDLLAQQRRWLIKAGAQIDEGVEVEVTPDVTYAGEGLEFVKGKKLQAGVITGPSDAEKLAA